MTPSAANVVGSLGAAAAGAGSGEGERDEDARESASESDMVELLRCTKLEAVQSLSSIKDAHKIQSYSHVTDRWRVEDGGVDGKLACYSLVDL